jgi:hypothetical protein
LGSLLLKKILRRVSEQCWFKTSVERAIPIQKVAPDDYIVARRCLAGLRLMGATAGQRPSCRCCIRGLRFVAPAHRKHLLELRGQVEAPGQRRRHTANIEDALLLFREARPEDTVILFLAGHGVMPEDAQRTGSGQWRPSSVVRWYVLQQVLQEAPLNAQIGDFREAA